MIGEGGEEKHMSNRPREIETKIKKIYIKKDNIEPVFILYLLCDSKYLNFFLYQINIAVYMQCKMYYIYKLLYE